MKLHFTSSVDEPLGIRRLAELTATLDRVFREAPEIREDVKLRSRRPVLGASTDLSKPQTPCLDNEQPLRQDEQHSS